jgi:hypothetical protein
MKNSLTEISTHHCLDASPRKKLDRCFSFNLGFRIFLGYNFIFFFFIIIIGERRLCRRLLLQWSQLRKLFIRQGNLISLMEEHFNSRLNQVRDDGPFVLGNELMRGRELPMKIPHCCRRRRGVAGKFRQQVKSLYVLTTQR